MHLMWMTAFAYIIGGDIKRVTCYDNLRSSIRTEIPITNESMYADYPFLRELDMSNQTSFQFPEDRVLLIHRELSQYVCNNCGIRSVYKQSLSKLPQLTDFQVTYGVLEYVHPNAFEYNNRLDKIDLSGNRLITFNPESVVHHLSSLSILHFSDNPELDLNQVKLESIRLMIFSCNNCGTTYLDRYTLAGMGRLVQVSLNDSPIERIDYDALEPLSYLKSLNLDGNRGLQSLNFTSKSLKRLSAQNCSLEGTLRTSALPWLVSINVRGNRITHLEELPLLANQRIENLLLDDNEIEKIPDKLMKMSQLLQLCVDQNLLQPFDHAQQAAMVYRTRNLRDGCFLDDDVSRQFEYHLPSARGVAVYKKHPIHRVTNGGVTMDLSNENIVYIEKDYLADHRDVKELRFDNNHEFALQESRTFLESESIESLSMQNCSNIAVYETSFEKLPNLKSINLENNKLRTLHSSSLFRSNPKITFINLAANELMMISVRVFEHLSQLEVLILDGNRNLTSTSNGFILSPSLRNLSCAHCGFVRLDDDTMTLLPNLRSLNLAHNSIETIESRTFPTTLEYVNLRNNPLKSFEPSIYQLSHLRGLCLSGQFLDDVVFEQLESRKSRVALLEKDCKEEGIFKRMMHYINRTTRSEEEELVVSTPEGPPIKRASLMNAPIPLRGFAHSPSVPLLLISVVILLHFIRTITTRAVHQFPAATCIT